MNYSSTELIAQYPTWYYTDFEQRVWQIATALQQQQIHTVALWFEDGAKLACTLLACWHANVRTLFLPNFTEESIAWANQLADIWLADVPVHLSNAKYFDEFANQLELQKSEKKRPLADFIADTQLLMKTSGSTGQPKTIIKTAGQLWKNAQVCAQAFGFESGNQITAVCTVSIQHLYGLICQIMMPLVLGWQIGRKQQFFPENVAQVCRQTKKTVLISSPTMLASIDWQRLSFPTLSEIVSAGGILPSGVAEMIFNSTGFHVTDFYGTTEAGAIAFKQDSSLWQPMPTAKVGIDERSTLWIEADWLEGREQCEDVVEFSNQQFAILGRIDRIIKLGDKRISLASVEQNLQQHMAVSDCYIGKHPLQNRLVAWVALSSQGIQLYKQNRKILVATLKQHLSITQEKVALPRFWRFTDKLPRNSQSKISKMAFEQICTAEQLDQFGVLCG
ncbi:AMP-binding protein [Actinobacillus suis]|uniref:AMP-binding enzyme n=2 Tax=Actinobacillus suis TaxID=716 RepID=K0G6U7_ACTSU|nr:class I adenylate-forming enzyme family protein [Actinobacillus suis]AFU20071.1 AMP-binding enzyme [Actinobacillus suis H91-0380]AIJ32210.1 AMP-binding enzyme [Actinobacillus suis ATCC 33415]MCO4167817.1 acyl--CoA ligase [Actinobacillus suis]MCO4169704.1 acyl--CoA ligase [Actinobacillus suis]MCQ9630809.1 acyl--CoA ligase [Actinobacillus suis]